MQPRNGVRMQPTACPELVEGAQAVGDSWENHQAPKGRKKILEPLGANSVTNKTAYNAGGFAAINSTNRLSFRNSANSTSL